MYADDITITITGNSMDKIKTSGQKAIDHVQLWANENKITLAEDKTNLVMFTKHTGQILNPKLKLNNKLIKTQLSQNYLGVTFDSHLSWKKQINNTLQAITKRQTFINAIASKFNDIPRKILLLLTKSTILSKLDYASILYSTASQQLLYKLDVKWNQTLRKITNAMPSTPIPALHLETHTYSLKTRRKILHTNYIIKKRTTTSNDLIKTNIIDQINFFPNEQTNNLPAIIFISKSYTNEFNPLICKIEHYKPLNGLTCIDTSLQLQILKKTEEQPLYLKNLTLQYINEINFSQKIYTDGSKQGNKTGLGVWFESRNFSIKERLPDESSIFQAEIKAIEIAITEIQNTETPDSFLICSDSLSSLLYLANYQVSPTKEMAKISQMIKTLQERNFTIKIIWIPSHIGLYGNEMADKMAKESLTQQISLLTTNHPVEIQKRIKEHLIKEEHLLFKNKCKNKYLKIVKDNFITKNLIHPNKNIANTIFRIRTGHNKTNASLFRWKITTSPLCDLCKIDEDAEHLIMNCSKYNQERHLLEKNVKNNAGGNFDYDEIIGITETGKQESMTRILGLFLRETKLLDYI